MKRNLTGPLTGYGCAMLCGVAYTFLVAVWVLVIIFA